MIIATVRGRIGSDPQMRYTAGGLTILSASVASNSKQGDVEQTTWVRLALFGQLAEAYEHELRKGTRVRATGKLKIREYTDKSGAARYSVDLAVDEIGIENSWESGEKRALSPRAASSVGPSALKKAEVSFSDDDIPF